MAFGSSTSSASSLIGGGFTGPGDDEFRHPGQLVIKSELCASTIDNVFHVGDGQRGLGHVSRHDTQSVTLGRRIEDLRKNTFQAGLSGRGASKGY